MDILDNRWLALCALVIGSLVLSSFLAIGLMHAYIRLVVARSFPREERDKVMALLNQYGTGPNEGGRDRIQLAILKLSKGNIEDVRRYVQAAKEDFRDVLLWEYYGRDRRPSSRPVPSAAGIQFKPPILVVTTDDGSVEIFSSIEGPEGFLTPLGRMEAQFIEEGLYVAYDREGRLLNMRVIGRPTPKRFLFRSYIDTIKWVTVQPAESEPTRAGELHARLVFHLSSLGQPEEELKKASLAELVGRVSEHEIRKRNTRALGR